jgi:hypothetical protein
MRSVSVTGLGITKFGKHQSSLKSLTLAACPIPNAGKLANSYHNENENIHETDIVRQRESIAE